MGNCMSMCKRKSNNKSPIEEIIQDDGEIIENVIDTVTETLNDKEPVEADTQEEDTSLDVNFVKTILNAQNADEYATIDTDSDEELANETIVEPSNETIK